MIGMEIGKIILAFMVLINPLGGLSIYLEMTQNLSTRERRKVAKNASIAVMIAITAFTLTGSTILKLFGISVGAFQVGGGILVLLIAISLMNGGNNPAKPEALPEEGKDVEVSNRSNHNIGAIAVVPLAIPITVGPGGISTVIIYASAAKDYRDTILILIAGLFISLICYIILLAAARVSQKLGDTGVIILNRIMGMLLAAVSVEIIVAGLKALFPQLNV
ncbi:MarC family protein [Neisseria montereyensis]|uniref:UPF0056 membrane protein n=1 Tax=Neisseria montereyensis TaxID=2973938 RepID=A0ABT2FA09_9NEIS|nr:MarC family protein [Neisseria montereyensis]MCS4533046.1 MarC family protein [Neisseria montereyensis]